MTYFTKPFAFDNSAGHSETSAVKSQPVALAGTTLPSWSNYNGAVNDSLSAIAAAELAASAYYKSILPPEPDGFEFRYCLPGPSGYSAYRNRSSGEMRFMKFNGSSFVELGHRRPTLDSAQ